MWVAEEIIGFFAADCSNPQRRIDVLRQTHSSLTDLRDLGLLYWAGCISAVGVYSSSIGTLRADDSTYSQYFAFSDRRVVAKVAGPSRDPLAVTTHTHTLDALK
jgi:hypothetical protein